MAVDTKVFVEAMRETSFLVQELTKQAGELAIEMEVLEDKLSNEEVAHMATRGELADALAALANMTRERDSLLEMVAARAQPSVP